MSTLIRRALLCFSLLFFPLIPTCKLDYSNDALAQKTTGVAKERQRERRRMVEEQIIARSVSTSQRSCQTRSSSCCAGI